jgi:hypothetical protein
METISSPSIGLGDSCGGFTVSELSSALTIEQYRRLIGFARFRLRAATNSRWLQQSLGAAEPEDLVHQAILKLYLGEENPSLGRHLKQRQRLSVETFINGVKGIISSDLSNLVNEARYRHEHTFVGDPEEESGAVEPAEYGDTQEHLCRRDLQRVFFRQLYQRIQNQPALLAVVQDWEQRFYSDDGIGDANLNRDLVYRVRQLAREVMADLGEFSPTISQEMAM